VTVRHREGLAWSAVPIRAHRAAGGCSPDDAHARLFVVRAAWLLPFFARNL